MSQSRSVFQVSLGGRLAERRIFPTVDWGDAVSSSISMISILLSCREIAAFNAALNRVYLARNRSSGMLLDLYDLYSSSGFLLTTRAVL